MSISAGGSARSQRPLDPDGTEVYELISNVRDALDELATALEQRNA